MTISADTHIILGIQTPKKDAVFGEGDPVLSLADDTCAIWANGVANVALTQTLIGTWHILHSWVQSEQLKDVAAPTWVSLLPGKSDPQVGVAPPAAGEVGLYIPLDIANGAKSHFLDRTFKRLLERWLELSKNGVGAAPAAVRVSSVGNLHTFLDEFDGGEVIEVLVRIIDPDRQVDEDAVRVVLPPTDPPGGRHPPAVVALVVCARLDALVHIRCSVENKSLLIEPAAPSNEIESVVVTQPKTPEL